MSVLPAGVALREGRPYVGYAKAVHAQSRRAGCPGVETAWACRGWIKVGKGVSSVVLFALAVTVRCAGVRAVGDRRDPA